MTAPLRSERGELAVVRAALDDTYEILDELGRGGMAIVYRARERQLDREVAIKVLPFSLAFDDDLVARFQREARLSAQLEHPHIVPIYRVGRSGDVIYFVMKLLRGQSLSARLDQRTRLPASEVERILTETASALGHAHRRGIVHRDVKPDNIMLDEDNRCVITDFGIARSAAESKLTATGMSIGTPRYMSPEQARAREVDGRGDLYSLGIVGYECLVGHVPFDGSDPFAILMHHVQSPVPRPPLDHESVETRRVYDVIERMLAKEPDDRLQSAEDVIAALESGGLSELTPRMGAPATAPIHGLGRAPTSSAVLDSALDAGIELLKLQRPRLESAMDAGLAAGRRIVDANAPRIRSAAARADDARVQMGSALAPRLGRFNDWRRARTPSYWKRAGGATVAACVAVLLARHALLMRSRCPTSPARPSGVGDSAASIASARTFDVRVDAPRSRVVGRDMDVYYDVCGLDAGSVRTRLVVTKQESGLKRLFNAVDPVAVSFDDDVSGPRTRRRRSIAMDAMPPGAYTVDLVVRDDRGRRRAASADFHLGGP
ncbi:MAG: serine/threonine-protein kinase [Gemmatimonadaceae bacterium]